jgi:hypothetical protein
MRLVLIFFLAVLGVLSAIGSLHRCAPGLRGRGLRGAVPSAGGVLRRCRSGGNEVIAEEFGVSSQLVQVAVLLLGEIIVFASFLIGFSLGHHRVEDHRQLPGGGCDGFGRAETGAHAAIEGSQKGLASAKRLGRLPEGPGCSALHRFGLAALEFAATGLLVWRQS